MKARVTVVIHQIFQVLGHPLRPSVPGEGGAVSYNHTWSHYGGPEVHNTTANQKPGTQIRKHERKSKNTKRKSETQMLMLLCFLICICVF